MTSITTAVDLEYILLVFSTNLHDPIVLNCSIRNHSFETEMMRFIEQANKHHPRIILPPRFQIQKRHFWIQTLTKVPEQPSHWCANALQTYSNSSPRATHQESKKTSSKARLRDFSEQTLLKKCLKSSSKILNHANVKEVIPRFSFKGHSRKCNFKTGNLYWRSFKNHRRANKAFSDELKTNPHERLAKWIMMRNARSGRRIGPNAWFVRSQSGVVDWILVDLNEKGASKVSQESSSVDIS